MAMRLIRFLPVGLVLAAAACSPHEASAPPGAPASTSVVRARTAMVSLSFKVEAIDAARRSVTLKSPEGAVGTFLVGDEVKRFSEVKVGDTLVVQYHVGVLEELREATVEEKAAPIRVQEGLSRAPSDVPPVGALTRTVRVVTTIDALDKPAQTVTLKGPLQNTLTAKVEDSALYPSLKVGQPVVATFAEQLVLAIEPGTPNK